MKKSILLLLLTILSISMFGQRYYTGGRYYTGSYYRSGWYYGSGDNKINIGVDSLKKDSVVKNTKNDYYVRYSTDYMTGRFCEDTIYSKNDISIDSSFMTIGLGVSSTHINIMTDIVFNKIFLLGLNFGMKFSTPEIGENYTNTIGWNDQNYNYHSTYNSGKYNNGFGDLTVGCYLNKIIDPKYNGAIAIAVGVGIGFVSQMEYQNRYSNYGLGYYYLNRESDILLHKSAFVRLHIHKSICVNFVATNKTNFSVGLSFVTPTVSWK